MKLICPSCDEEKTPCCIDCLRENLVKEPMTSEIVIFIEGGCVQDIASNDPDISIILIDRDNELEGDIQPDTPKWYSKDN